MCVCVYVCVCETLPNSLVGDIHVPGGPPTVALTHDVCVCVCVRGYYSLCDSKFMHVFESPIPKSASV